MSPSFDRSNFKLPNKSIPSKLQKIFYAIKDVISKLYVIFLVQYVNHAK